MADMTVSIRVLYQGAQAEAGLSRLGATAQSSAAQVQTAAKTTAASASSIQRSSALAGKALLLGIGAGLAISAKAAIDFESSFAGIRKTVDASEAQFGDLENTMRGLAKTIPINVNELNRIGELGGQLGLGVEALEGFTDTVAKLGVTTNLSTESASFALARLAKILTIPTSQFGNLGSAVVDLGNNFATTEDEITTFALRIAPVGAVVGLTGAQVLGLATAFSSVGVPAERGGTAVQRVFSTMADAVATGGDKLESFARTAGMTAERFAIAFEDNAAQAFNEFIQGLNKIDEAGGNVFEVLRDVGLANERTVQALLAVANAEGLLTESLRISEDAWRDNLALNEEAGKRFDTTASKMALAVNHITDLRIEIGQNLLPVIGNWAKGLADLVQWIQDWNDETKRGVGQVALLSAALLASLKTSNLLAKALGINLTASLAKATVGMSLFGGVAVRVLGRLGVAGALFLAVDAIVGFIGKQVEAARLTREFTDALKEESEGLRGVATALLSAQLGDIFPPEAQIALARVGISLDDIAEKIRNGEDITHELGIAFADLMDQAQREVTADVFKSANVELSKTVSAIEGVIGAFEKADRITEALRDAEARVGSFADKIAQQAIQAKYAEGATKGYREEIDLTGDSAEEAADEIRKLSDAQLASRDSAFSLIDSLFGLADAQAAYNDESTTENALALQKAWVQMIGAARALGTQGIDPLIANLEEMRAAGIITAAQYFQMLQILSLLGPVMAGAGSAASASLINFANTTGTATDIVVDNADAMIRAMYAVVNATGFAIKSAGDAFSAFGANITQFGILVDGLAPVSTITAWGTELQNLGDTLAGLGSGFTASGGSGLDDAIETDFEKALRVAQEGANIVADAVSASIRYRDALRAVTEAEETLADLRQRRKDLPGLIADKERELAEARRLSREVTLDEQKAIEDSLEAFKRAQRAYAQGVITATDLAIAERDYQEALEESTAMSPEVAQLKEELRALKEEKREIREEIRQAREDLASQQLRLVESQLAMIEAGEAFAEASKKQIRAFKAIAEEAGLARKEVKKLLNNYAQLSAIAFGTAPNPFPEIPSLHTGGMVPGPAGKEVLIKALAGEVVVNPRLTPASSPFVGGIGTLVINLKGVWDLTDPRQMDRVMTTVETQLERRARSKR